ncbi:winged helix-turn-helix transcriptional regulator [Levilactobacillus suantsaiihabitans]|uniref:Transcriptional regulator n=1 Tax=Levilactobacillus suantsaiihabitans TaxID=2487722 RepID=A0A4Z0JC65_9LACO|nr:helix-turn-helix domain-containing protein [Levilactobacillus suantsaiihabitans]TGD20044.1 transcriptional regulator [Levilactobacillus suantsaiihabitans]
MQKQNYFLGCNYIIDLVGGKWKPSIICSLGLGDKRFGELRHYFKRLYGVTPAEKVLSEQLHQLIENNMVKRTSYDVMPMKVVYSLTDEGKRLKALLVQMTQFAESIQNDSVHFKYSSKAMLGLVDLNSRENLSD